MFKEFLCQYSAELGDQLGYDRVSTAVNRLLVSRAFDEEPVLIEPATVA
jgi:hypothetical protein